MIFEGGMFHLMQISIRDFFSINFDAKDKNQQHSNQFVYLTVGTVIFFGQSAKHHFPQSWKHENKFNFVAIALTKFECQ